MDGIYINGERPKSKKVIKEMLAFDPSKVSIDATSMFGGFSGPVTEGSDGDYMFVGPCPHTKRNFYGTITKRNGKITVK